MTLTEEARVYFSDIGLTYADIKREDLEMLESMLDVELRKPRYLRPLTAQKAHLHRSVGFLYCSFTPTIPEVLEWARIGMSARYEYDLHCISFNRDGNIYFCLGFHDTEEDRVAPVEAFKDWCDLVLMRKQAIEIDTGKVHA